MKRVTKLRYTYTLIFLNTLVLESTSGINFVSNGFIQRRINYRSLERLMSPPHNHRVKIDTNGR